MQSEIECYTFCSFIEEKMGGFNLISNFIYTFKLLPSLQYL